MDSWRLQLDPPLLYEVTTNIICERKKHIFTTGRVDPFTQHGRQRHTQTPWYYLAEDTVQPILLQKYCHLVARVSLLLLIRRLIRCNVDDFSVDDTFALEHGGNGACGIPDGDTIIMTGGFGQNYVTRFVLELEVTGLEKHLIYTTLNTCRYNTSGFVEELPQLPDIRRGHACLSFPTTGVRSKGPKSKPNL